jgi:hypothetical protein
MGAQISFWETFSTGIIDGGEWTQTSFGQCYMTFHPQKSKPFYRKSASAQ